MALYISIAHFKLCDSARRVYVFHLTSASSIPCRTASLHRPCAGSQLSQTLVEAHLKGVTSARHRARAIVSIYACCGSDLRCRRLTRRSLSLSCPVFANDRDSRMRTTRTPGISSCADSSSSIGTHSSELGSRPMILMRVCVDFCTTRMRENTTLATSPV